MTVGNRVKLCRGARGCGNEGRMHKILNGEPLEEVDCFKYLVQSQVAADGGLEMDVLHRMNEYRAREALKSVLSNSGLVLKVKKCLYEGVIVPTSLYGAEAWGMHE